MEDYEQLAQDEQRQQEDDMTAELIRVGIWVGVVFLLIVFVGLSSLVYGGGLN